MTDSEIQAILQNHDKQLANHQLLLMAMKDLVDIIKAAQDAHQQVFEALQRAVSEKMGGEPPAEPGPGPLN